MALTAIRYGAQNSVAIGGTADITGLEAAGGWIENDPQLTIGCQFCCGAHRPLDVVVYTRRPVGGLGDTVSLINQTPR